MAAVVVVGGGIIGCAVAERLVRDGHRVTLLERDTLGSKASGGAAGLLAPHSEAANGRPFADLASRSQVLFPDLVSRLEPVGVDVEYRELESLCLAADELEAQSLRSRLGPAAGRWLDAQACRELEPGLASDFTGGLLFREGQVTPRRLVLALARAAARAGAEIREGAPVEGLAVGGAEARGVRMAGGRIPADWVVLAAGPWTPGLAAGLGAEVDVAPRRGQLVTLLPNHRVVDRILTLGSSYVVPKPDGTVVVGSTEEAAGFEANPTAAGVAGVLDLALRWLPSLGRARLVGTWAGLRPITSTGLPLIGPLAGFENIVLATGHHRNGILLAPITAEIVAAGIGGRWEVY